MLSENIIKGQLVELKVQEEFIRYGFDISIPNYNASKYDLLVDTGKELLKIQIKKSIGKTEHSFTFPCTSQNVRSNSDSTKHKYTKDEIDYFATVWNDKVYLIPVNECSTSKTLRLSPPKNNSPIYNKADDYDIETVIGYSKDLISSKKLFEERQKNQSSVVKQYFCKNCGKLLSGKTIGGVCSKCNSIQSRTVERPSRDELKMLIRTLPFTQIASSYGVSDNAIRKWCDAEGLPRKVSEIKQYSEEEWKSI